LAPAQWKRVKPVIAEFFDIEGGVWRQRRLHDEREAVKQLSLRQSAKGTRSAEVRALKTKGRHKTAVKSGSTRTQPDANRNSTSPTPTLREKDIDKSISKKTMIFDEWVPKQFGAGTQCAKIVATWDADERESQREGFIAYHQRAKTEDEDFHLHWKTWVLNSRSFKRERIEERGGSSSGNGNDGYLQHVLDKVIPSLEGDRR
jgi:hypothetical protein